MSINFIRDPIIDSIIKHMDEGNKPSKKSIIQKKELNKEFEKKANIKGFVSYIYYPSQRGDLQGHSELEVEGNSYTLTNATNIRDIMKGLVFSPFQRRGLQEHVRGNRNVKSLSRMIEWTRMGSGLPFFRFNISVTPNQLDELREGISTTNSTICSVGAAKALKQYVNFKIPLPLAISPLASAIYLITVKKLGSQRIYQIESYGNPLENLSKIIPGIVGESILGLVSMGALIQNSYYAYRTITE
jgi:hypothetical protein